MADVRSEAEQTAGRMASCGSTSRSRIVVFATAGLSPRGWVQRVFALALLCSAASPLRAQGMQSNAEGPREGEEIKGDTRVIEIDEVERGFFVSVDAGVNYYIFQDQPNFVKLNQNFLLPGTRLGLRVGYDILNNLAVDAFVMANFNQGVLDTDALATGALTGDLAHFAPGLGVRFSFITTDRFHAFARAGVGYALWLPGQLANPAAGDSDIVGSFHTDVSLGVEYHTKLRHLAVGLEVAGQALIAPFAFGVHVYPVVKYTF